MRLLLAILMAVTVVAGAVCADSWAYVYGGVDDPKKVCNGWSGTALVLEPPAWNVLADDGCIALRLVHSQTNFAGNLPSYSKGFAMNGTVPAHSCLIWTWRFKLVGGAPSSMAQANHYERVNFQEERSRLRREATGGDNWYDPDMTNKTTIGPYTPGWHTYTLLMVGETFGATNPGAVAYLDGVVATTRPPGLVTTKQASQRFGFFGVPNPFPDAEIWVDYIAYGYDDTLDEQNRLGWLDVDGNLVLPALDPDYIIPEPSSLLTLGMGVLGAAWALRRRLGR